MPALSFLDSQTALVLLIMAVIVLFGSARLPKLARSLRDARKEFEKGSDEGEKTNDQPPASAATAPPAVPPQHTPSPAPPLDNPSE
jgi:Sec-independent protein translocase protein TatA